MRLVSRELLYESPGRGSLVYGDSYYTRPSGVELVATRGVETRSDLIDSMELRRSADNGRSWSEPVALKVVEKTQKGMRRLFPMPGWVDPVSGRLLGMAIEGVLPADDALEDGMRHYYLRYRVSLDGEQSWAVDEQALQRARPGKMAGTATRPFDGVTVGKNSMMLGDKGSVPLRTRGGRILVPVQVCPVGPDGEYWNPGGGYTYHDAAVLIGRWAEGNRIDLGPLRVHQGGPGPLHARLHRAHPGRAPDGRILMVLRGSNGGTKDPEHRIPGYRWYTVSRDQGSSWEPVTSLDVHRRQALFHSPSSMSLLMRHSSGGYYWLGQHLRIEPSGEQPALPLCHRPRGPGERVARA